MSKFDLRDVSERLSASADTEAVVFEFLGYLQAVQPDWRASLAFYEVSQDSLVNIYQRETNRLIRRDVAIQVDQLPGRLVRKFFHPSANFNPMSPRTILSQWLQSSPYYEPDSADRLLLRILVPVADWGSCVCLPLADREDILALLVIASEKKRAFGSRALADLIPVKNVAAMALAQHLHRAASAAKSVRGPANPHDTRVATTEFQDRIRSLNTQAEALELDNRAKAAKLEALRREVESRDQHSSDHTQELERSKVAIMALEEQTVVATQHLNDAYTELNLIQSRVTELERTFSFMKDVFQLLSREHGPADMSSTVVTWLCESFSVERCSVMLIDRPHETLSIAASCGIDPAIAAKVRVRIGQGVAGWVAHNRKPLFVRVRDEVPGVERQTKETYNSDSFICVPMLHNNDLVGVLNLSNKRDGEPFERIDLDRAAMLGSLLALALGGHRTSRPIEAWT